MRHVFTLFSAVLIITLGGCSGEAGSSGSLEEVETAGESVIEVSQDAQAYPIDYCLVSGEKLGSMGDTIEVTVEGRTVKLCCTMCESKLRKDSDKYLAILDAAATGDATPSPTDDAADGHAHE